MYHPPVVPPSIPVVSKAQHPSSNSPFNPNNNPGNPRDTVNNVDVTNTNTNTNEININSNINQTSNTSNDLSNKNSASNLNTNNFKNITIEANNTNQFTTFSNGSSLPSASLYADVASYDGNEIYRIGVSIPLGSNRKTVLRGVKQSSDLELLNFCTNMHYSGITIDYDALPQFEICKGLLPTPLAVMPEAPTETNSQLSEAKTAIKAALEQNAKLKVEMNLIQMKIKQMQTTPTKTQVSW
jgi:hypothetical protein